MKAIIVDQPGPLENARLREVPDPTAGPSELVLQVRAIEANFPDILVMEGQYQFKPPLPFSPGKAAAGIVESVGPGVRRFQPGDRVAVQVEYGAYAEKLVSKTETCYPMPHEMPFEDAAALGLVYQTAHFALMDRASISEGESVLILGASGGIGVASIQLARALGAGRVIAAVLGEENIDIANNAGADATINLQADKLGADLSSRLREQVHAHNEGNGVDIVIDPVGGDATGAALRCLRWRGRLVIIGFASGQIPTLKANYLLLKNIAVSGLQWSDYRDRDPEWVARVQGEIFQHYVNGAVKPHISEVFALANFQQALQRLRDGKVQGKLVLSV